jgi:hypothetical protein
MLSGRRGDKHLLSLIESKQKQVPRSTRDDFVEAFISLIDSRRPKRTR